MADVTSAVAESRSPAVPLRVTYAGTMLTVFRYRTSIPVGRVLENKETLQLKLFDNRCFKFVLKKTTQQSVSVTCERHVKDETLEAGSAVEEDGGCFLRLYISVIGAKATPKSAVLRSTDTSTSVEFREGSFLHRSAKEYRTYILKCVVRRIETTRLSNKYAREQGLLWMEGLKKACTTNKQVRDMLYVLKRRHLIELLTGRRTTCYLSPHIICKACFYSEQLVQYFKSKENSETVPSAIDVGVILGYLYDGRKTAISVHECRTLYMISVAEGLMFVKDLTTEFLIENLNDEIVVDVLEIADMSEDTRLFEAAYLYCKANKLRLFRIDKFKRLGSEKDLAARSIVHSVTLRQLGVYRGYPPPMEDETGEP